MRFPISPAQRWVLANLFLHRSLVINGGVTQDAVYNRARRELGLRGPMNIVLRNQDADTDYIKSFEPNAYVDLTEENRDFLIDRILSLDKHPFQSATLEDFIQRIVDWKRALPLEELESLKSLPHVTDLLETWNNVQEKEGN